MNNKKKRIFDIIQIGYAGDVASRTFDIAITAAIIINLFIAIFDTFEQSIPYQPVLDVIEWITVIGFTIEYILRVWTAEYLYPNKCTGIARINTSSQEAVLSTFYRSCQIICMYSSRQEQLLSVCSGL